MEECQWQLLFFYEKGRSVNGSSHLPVHATLGVKEKSGRGTYDDFKK